MQMLNGAFASYQHSINNWSTGQQLEKVNHDLRRKSELLQQHHSDVQLKRLQLLYDHALLRRDLSSIDTLELDATLYSERRSRGTKLAHKEVLESVFGEQDELMASWRIQMQHLSIQRCVRRSGLRYEVYEAELRGRKVSVKRHRVPITSFDATVAVRDEIVRLSQLCHPNVVQLIGVCCELPRPCIVSAWMHEGSLRGLLRKAEFVDGLNWTNGKLRIAMDAARGMCYLHSLDPILVHLDLKTASLLVDEDLRVKVSGSFNQLDCVGAKQPDLGRTTPAYAAPEKMQGLPYTEKADVYSFGIILWEIHTQCAPFQDASEQHIFSHVTNNRLRPPLDASFPASIAKLVALCWSLQPEDRPSFEQVLQNMETMRSADLNELPQPFAMQTASPRTLPPLDRISKGSNNSDTRGDGSARAALAASRESVLSPAGTSAGASDGANASGKKRAENAPPKADDASRVLEQQRKDRYNRWKMASMKMTVDTTQPSGARSSRHHTLDANPTVSNAGGAPRSGRKKNSKDVVWLSPEFMQKVVEDASAKSFCLQTKDSFEVLASWPPYQHAPDVVSSSVAPIADSPQDAVVRAAEKGTLRTVDSEEAMLQSQRV